MLTVFANIPVLRDMAWPPIRNVQEHPKSGHFIEMADGWHEVCERYPLPDAKPDEKPKAPALVATTEPGRLTL